MIELLKIKPMFNRIVTTMNAYEEDQYINGIIDTSRQKGSLKEYQTVISVGNTVRDIKEGDVVCIDPTRYMVTKHRDKSIQGAISDEVVVGYKFNIIKINGEDCLMLYDQDITFIVEESKETKNQELKIIQPEKPKIII